MHLILPVSICVILIKVATVAYTDAVSIRSVSIMLRSSSDGGTLDLAGTTMYIRGVCDEFTPKDRKLYEDLGEAPPNEILEG